MQLKTWWDKTDIQKSLTVSAVPMKISSAKKRETEYPWIVNLELTNSCNLECVFCDYRVLKNNMVIRDMDEELLNKILSDIKEGFFTNDKKIYELGLVGLGEPTLNKHLARNLALIDGYANIFNRISINSNLVSLNEEKAKLLLNSKINTYTFSVNASNRETYLKVSGRDVFGQVVKNLNLFFGLVKQMSKKPRIDVQVMDSKDNNLEELEAVLPGAAGLNINFFTRKIYTKPVIENGCDFINIEPVHKKKRYPCWSIYSRIYIDVEGNFYPCTIGNDSYRKSCQMCLGSTRNDSLLELFNNSKIQEARNRAEKGDLPFPECQKCNCWFISPNNFRWDKDGHVWKKMERQTRGFGLQV